MVIAERVGHESTGLIQTVYSHLMPDYEDRTRQVIDDARAAEAGPRLGCGCPTAAAKNCIYDHGRRAYDHGGRAGYSPPLDKWRRSLCTSEWYTRSATPQGGTA